MIELPVKGIPTNIIEKRKYFSKYENTPWHKNWNGDYDNYLEALNNLTKGESKLLFSDVVKASPKVGEYYPNENTFMNAAKDGKVGIVHNSISPSSINGVKLNYLPSKEPDPIEAPLPDDNLKVSLKNKYIKPSVKPVDKSNKKDKRDLKGVLPDWGFNKLGKTSGGQSFIRGTNKVSFNNKGLVSQRKNWLEDKIGEPLLELISDNKNKSGKRNMEDKINYIQKYQEGKKLQEKVYKTVRPSQYSDPYNYIRFLFNNKREEFDDPRSEEAFQLYLGLQKELKYLAPTELKPTIGKDVKGQYYKVDSELENDIFQTFKDRVKLNEVKAVNEADVESVFPENTKGLFRENGKDYIALVPRDKKIIPGRPMVSNARMLGDFTVSRGKDKKGEYISYADQYDFPKILQNKMKGNPYKIYGRIYYPKKQKGGYIEKQDNTRIDNSAVINTYKKSVYDSQKLEDYKNLSEIDFRERYGTSKHRYRYDNDPTYNQKFQKQAREAKSTIAYPTTDLRRGDNVAPNTKWMYPNLKGENKAKMTQFSNEVVEMGLPIPGLEAMGKIPSVVKAGKNLIKGANLGDDVVKQSKFKSEIKWGKWNKEIPNNKALMKEYEAIEKTSKANGTWMKNPNGSAFKGTPEQFVQQNSDNFKKAFPNVLRDEIGNVQKTYHGSQNTFDFFDPNIMMTGRTRGEGIYTSPIKERASTYATKGDKKLYEFYQNASNPQLKLDEFNKASDIRFNKFLQENPKGSKDFDKKFDEFMKNENKFFDKLTDEEYFKLQPGYDFYKAAGDEYVVPFTNYPKSTIGNNGMFDMTNPNIYKGLIPAAIVGTSAALQNKK